MTATATNAKTAGVVIAGGGLAAQRCAETLRSRGYEAPVRMVCAEEELPYDRPPLSKEILAGDLDSDTVHFRDAAWYADNDVELILGVRASGLDPELRRLELADGSVLDYDDLLIATGAEARSLPMFEGFTNAFALRTLDDARRLRSETRPEAHLAIVGAGFIGQEVASTARAQGAEVTIIEALDLPLSHVLGADVGRWLVDMHREEGCRVLLSTQVASTHGNGRVERLGLADGERINCDAVVVGVGVSPAADWLEGTGLEPDGIRTDTCGRTALPHVYAAGDVSRPWDHRLVDHARTEHWDAAARQGVAAATAMLGDEPRPAPLPSFWSDQYGLRIQYVGHAPGADEIRIDGEPGDRDFSALYHRDGRPVAGLAVNRPRELAAMRRLIDAAHQPVSDETPTKELTP